MCTHAQTLVTIESYYKYNWSFVNLHFNSHKVVLANQTAVAKRQPHYHENGSCLCNCTHQPGNARQISSYSVAQWNLASKQKAMPTIRSYRKHTRYHDQHILILVTRMQEQRCALLGTGCELLNIKNDGRISVENLNKERNFGCRNTCKWLLLRYNLFFSSFCDVRKKNFT